MVPGNFFLVLSRGEYYNDDIGLGMSSNNQFSKQIVIVLSVFVLAVNVLLGALLMMQSKKAIQDQMRERMLDISKSAAALLDGDVIGKLQKEDEGTEPYQHALDILRSFQEQVELRYIYGIRDMGNKTFTFTIDPTVEDPGEFGEPIMYTDALYMASLGIPSVDEKPYEDKWGRFYSAYSPVFDSAGKVSGIVAVDIDAGWFEKQLRNQVYIILAACVVSLLAGVTIVLIVTGKLRKRLAFLNSEINNLADDVEVLAVELRLASEEDHHNYHDAESGSGEDFDALDGKLKVLSRELQKYISDARSAAYIDSLSGLGNRNAYDKALKKFDSRIAEGAVCFSIAVFDINGLKDVNDNCGHEFGDLMITTVSDILKDCMNSDYLYRIGGDEFVAIKETDDSSAFEDVFKFIDRKLDERGNVLRIGEKDVPLAVSKGAASYIKGTDFDCKSVFRRADEAMYADKAAWYATHCDRRRKR